MHFGITNSKPRQGGRCHCGPAVSSRKEAPSALCGGNRDLEDRESHEQLHFGIGNPKTPMRDKTAVMGIVVIWVRILARRANV
jgi:hypothetical protein